MDEVKDVFKEFDDLFDGVLANIGMMIGSTIVTPPDDQQTVYEAFSNVCHYT